MFTKPSLEGQAEEQLQPQGRQLAHRWQLGLQLLTSWAQSGGKAEIRGMEAEAENSQGLGQSQKLQCWWQGLKRKGWP